jgi:Inositol hexakisphosphate
LPVAADAPTPVKSSNPLPGPYRTGSYLIYDFKPTDKDNFRRTSELVPHPYRASGSHQLDYGALAGLLASIPAPPRASTLYLVDLREETHGFLNERAVSWYADNDFSNVDQPQEWIVEDEKVRFVFAQAAKTVRLYDIVADPSDNRAQGRMLPVGYWDIPIKTARTEEQSFDTRRIGNFTIQYVRIAVTDHCAPSEQALKALRDLANKVAPTDWVHFHCHGGDGRTTTFLALYDMWRWKKANYPGYPSLETFACRQYKLAPNYCLDPGGCDCPPPPAASQPVAGWKRPLALRRWEALGKFHDDPLGGS